MPRYFYDDEEFPKYVSIGERRRKAERHAARLKSASPIVIDGTRIAKTFWGKSWCLNLERYSDYVNRLPRGRTYVRSGCVVDQLPLAPPGQPQCLNFRLRYTDGDSPVGDYSEPFSVTTMP